tara:strand:- start:78 stop:824 length:747 start_codon:yes stop_codon:yes gene_type:complete
MAFILDETWINNGQLIIAEAGVNPKALGEGIDKVKHSAYIEGPLQIGNAKDFETAQGTVMIGKDGNMETVNALFVKGDVTIVGNTGQTGDTTQTGDITATGTISAANFVGSVSTASGKSSGAKAFDVPHPTKDGYRLRHICIEGPESAVYHRGRLRSQKKIVLPKYWKGLVDIDTITVQLQPIGVHQDIIVKRWDDENVYLQAQGALPINCFFHVYAERKDIEKLIPEYEGTSIDDYPGDNSVYSINK